MASDISVDADEFEEGYRSLSGLAVFAVVLGLAAASAFAAPLLTVVPLVGIAVSLAALRAIAANPDVYTGRPLALVGLALSMAFLVAPTVQRKVADRLLANQAEPTARAWLEHVGSGRLDQSFTLTLSYGDRLRRDMGAKGEGPGGENPIAAARKAYDEDPTVAAVIDVGPGAKVERTDFAASERAGSRRLRLPLRFRVTGAGGDSVDVGIMLERTTPREALPEWHVAGYSTEEG